MRLHVNEQGSGSEVCVLLHGMMGSAESWWRVAPELIEAGYRVLAIDLPGHGHSDRDLELTVERAADAVVTFTKTTFAHERLMNVGGLWPRATPSRTTSTPARRN